MSRMIGSLGRRGVAANPRRVGRVAAALLLLAWAPPLLASSREWPQWRGPNRDGLSTERGLLRKWPEGGPRLRWTAQGIGRGFATVAVAGGSASRSEAGAIYTAGNVGDETVISALDLDGKIRWQVSNGPAARIDPPGSRGTPTIDGGLLYHESPLGHILCLDPKTRTRVWSVDMLKEFQGRNITWGLSESLLIEGSNVVCSPGGPEAGVVALHKQTGKTVWVCDGLGDKPGYASPIVFSWQGLRQICTMTANAVVGIHAQTGKLLWRFEHKTAHDANIPTPIYYRGHIFINSGYGSGGVLLRVLVKGSRSAVREVWRTKGLDNHHGGVILVGGHLYGSAHNGEWVCLDLRTGKVMYKAKGVGKGSLTYADGMLYTYSENGTVGLVRATPAGHQVISQFKVPKRGRGPNWAHPVVCDGRLYLRHDDFLFCYDIKGN